MESVTKLRYVGLSGNVFCPTAKKPIIDEKAVRALLLGEKHQGRLVYKGKVGSGLTIRQRQDFLAELAKAPKLQEPVDCPSGFVYRLPGWRCRICYFLTIWCRLYSVKDHAANIGTNLQMVSVLSRSQLLQFYTRPGDSLHRSAALQHGGDTAL